MANPMETKMLAITDSKKLNVLISGVKTSGKAFEAKLHLAAYSCLVVIDESGDIRPMARLYEALGGRVLRTALATWANAFGKVKITEATGETALEVKYVKAKESDLPTAMATPVSDYKPEAGAGAGSAFELAKKLAQTIKGATKDGVTLSTTELQALAMVEHALALLDPEFKPASNVVPMPKPKAARKPKAEVTAAAA